MLSGIGQTENILFKKLNDWQFFNVGFCRNWANKFSEIAKMNEMKMRTFSKKVRILRKIKKSLISQALEPLFCVQIQHLHERKIAIKFIQS